MVTPLSPLNLQATIKGVILVTFRGNANLKAQFPPVNDGETTLAIGYMGLIYILRVVWIRAHGKINSLFCEI